MKDSEVPESKRVLYALGIRITLAVALIAVIIHGAYTGKIGNHAPWDVPTSRVSP